MNVQVRMEIPNVFYQLPKRKAQVFPFPEPELFSGAKVGVEHVNSDLATAIRSVVILKRFSERELPAFKTRQEAVTGLVRE